MNGPAAPRSSGQDAQYLIFTLAGLRCALPRAAVQELLPLPRLSRPPSLPAAVTGFLNLGGMAVPVLALDHLLGLPPVEAEAGGLYRHIVLLQRRPAIGLLVDRVLDLAAVPAEGLRPVPPEQTLNGCVAATLALPEGFASLLDPARILMAQEEASLEELTRRANERLETWSSG